MSPTSNYVRLRQVTYWSLMCGVLVGWTGAVVGVVGAVESDEVSLPALSAVGVGLVVLTVLYVRAVAAAVDGRTPVLRELVAGGVIAAVIMVTQEPYPSAWGLVGAMWTGMAVIGRSQRQAMAMCAGAALFCVLTAGGGLAAIADGDEASVKTFYVVICGCVYAANSFQLWFWEVVKAASEGKEALARLAVTEERLRFSRDMHDLVGHSLSAIAVKSEVAKKLAGVDAERAAAEMDEVRRLARESLREIRMAVRGYRTVELPAELRSVQAVLEAASIRCTLTMPETELPDHLGTLLAWVVREGTTNVLRHSAATTCRIRLSVGGEHATLEMINDGHVVNAEEPGSGLAGLAERLAPLGGILMAGAVEGGEFVLRATVPVGGTR